MRRNLIAKMYKKKIYSSQVKKRSHFMSAVFLRNLTLKYGIWKFSLFVLELNDFQVVFVFNYFSLENLNFPN